MDVVAGVHVPRMKETGPGSAAGTTRSGGGIPKDPTPAVTVRGQATEQGEPLRANEVAAAPLPVWVAWKPMLVVPLAGMAAL